ncbi:hypothetical protein VHEMI06869 [[Torrubiella] hemipterigena]|uniref:Condensation domain-containing protein n=1 Tax=[Torrubiella] hemipterigena TaxID=1531966 RepID=A0A0A1T1U2_9HYPO|nr:hypothetical protein VHEMI06869 [[Torrubiella] hemipterigena]
MAPTTAALPITVVDLIDKHALETPNSIAAEWHVQDTIASLHKTFRLANQWQWSYPELTEIVKKTYGDSYWFDSSIIILWDMVIDTESWQIASTQPRTASGELDVADKDGIVHLMIQYDTEQIAAEEVENLRQDFVQILGDLVKSSSKTTVDDIV